MWNAADAGGAQGVLNGLVDSCGDRHSAFAEWIESSVPEGFVVFALSNGHTSRYDSRTQ